MPTAQFVSDDKSLPNGTLADVLVAIGALDAKRAEQIKLAEIQSGSSTTARGGAILSAYRFHPSPASLGAETR